MHGIIGMKKIDRAPDIRASFPVGDRWYVIRTNIRCEFRAQYGLDAEGFRTFLPRITKWRRHARTSEVVDIALFPRYLFLEADFNLQSIDRVHRTNGVESIVNNNGVPSSIYSEFIWELITRQMKGEFDETKTEKMPVGGKIAVVEGKYDGALGHIAKLPGNQRAEVIISIMGQKQRQILRLAELRPAC